jgi:hypothetical protein
MAFPLKQVRTLEERLRISEEVQKTHQRRGLQATRPATINPKYDYCEGKDQRALIHVCGQELTTCGVLCVEKMCDELGSGSCVEEVQGGGGGGDNDEAELYGSTLCV